MKKLFFGLLCSLLLVSGSAFATVACKDGFQGCQFPDPMLGNAPQPAILFNMATSQRVHIEAEIWDNDSCAGASLGTAAGDLDLGAGPIIVFLRFDPPLPPGTVLSIVWKVGQCDRTDCIAYVIGDPDQVCPSGANTTVAVLDVQPSE